MLTITWTVFELLINALEAVIFVWFTCSSLGFRNIKTARALPFVITSAVIFTMITLLNYYASFEGVAGFMYSAALFFLSLICLNGSVLKKLLVSLLPNVCMLLSSSLSLSYVSWLFGRPAERMWTGVTVYRLIFVLLSNALFALFIYLCHTLFVKKGVSLSSSEWLLMISVSVISICMFLCLYYLVFLGATERERGIFALLTIGLVTLNLATYFMLVRLSRNHKLSVENKLLRAQYSFSSDSARQIKLQYDELSKQRHDFKNNLLIIRSLCEQQKCSQAVEYIDNYFNLSRNSLCLISTDNDFVNAVVNSTLAKASQNGVAVRINVPKTIEGIDDIELCSVLSNLLENAVAAALECENGVITLEITNTVQGIEIFVKNSVRGSVLASNPTLKTSKSGAGHGFGTKIVGDIARKYHGMVDYYEDGDFFCCNVSLYYK